MNYALVAGIGDENIAIWRDEDSLGTLKIQVLADNQHQPHFAVELEDAVVVGIYDVETVIAVHEQVARRLERTAFGFDPVDDHVENIGFGDRHPIAPGVDGVGVDRR